MDIKGGNIPEVDAVFMAWLNNGLVEDSNNVTSLDWENRTLNNQSEDVSIDYDGGYLYDASTYSALSWTSRILLADDGATTMLDWSDSASPTIADGTYPSSGDYVSSITIVGGRITDIQGAMLPPL